MRFLVFFFVLIGSMGSALMNNLGLSGQTVAVEDDQQQTALCCFPPPPACPPFCC